MRRHHSIQISPGRFPALDDACVRPGQPKPRLQTPRDMVTLTMRPEGIR